MTIFAYVKISSDQILSENLKCEHLSISVTYSKPWQLAWWRYTLVFQQHLKSLGRSSLDLYSDKNFKLTEHILLYWIGFTKTRRKKNLTHFKCSNWFVFKLMQRIKSNHIRSIKKIQNYLKFHIQHFVLHKHFKFFFHLKYSTSMFNIFMKTEQPASVVKREWS